MNYKCFTDEALPTDILSYFHRGFFWGIIFAWIAGISVAMGATITKSAYLDRRDYQLVSRSNFRLDDEISLDQQSLDPIISTKSKPLTNPKTVSIKKSSFTFPQISFFQAKFASLVSNKYSRTNLAQSSNKLSLSEPITRQKIQQDQILRQQDLQILETRKNVNEIESDFDKYLSSHNADSQKLTYVVDSESRHSSLDKFSSSNEISNFKQSKIVIRNSTNNPEVGAYISGYLQERDFVNIEISNDEIYQGSTSKQGLTVIRTDGQNSKSANYLKSILGFGDLELFPSGFLNTSDPSELIILLGNDAQDFSQNQDFVSFIN